MALMAIRTLRAAFMTVISLGGNYGTLRDKNYGDLRDLTYAELKG